MRTKVLTNDCPSCDDMKIRDDSKLECTWGISKEPKMLVDPKSKKGRKECKLKGDK